MPRINMFESMDVSGSALSAQRARLNAIARNIANAGTTKTETGEPYRRQEAIIEAVPERQAEAIQPAPITTERDREAALNPLAPVPSTGPPVLKAGAGDVPGGVRVAGLFEDSAEFPRVYDPSHPDADADGFVTMPNVNMINEMVDMMLASRAYEANLAAMNTSKDLLMKTLTIGRQ